MPTANGGNPLNKIVKAFDATESNLVKLEQLWKRIELKGEASGQDADAYHNLLDALPVIDGWKPNRLDGDETCDPDAEMRAYRRSFNKLRLQKFRAQIIELIAQVDKDLESLAPEMGKTGPLLNPAWPRCRENISQIRVLVGSSVSPSRWGDLHRHVEYGQRFDFSDIVTHDWPAVKPKLEKALYAEDEPIPVDFSDLSTETVVKSKGAVATKLNWDNLEAADFERLIFNLFVGEEEYENPQWLTHTNAPDRGRDISVIHVLTDALLGTRRRRVLIQCRHQQGSINVPDVATLKEQMSLWEPPRVDVLIIATTGRFTTDAVDAIEKSNQKDTALHIEMWPESKLELLLANRPDLIVEFNLR